jgi:hypothetical protein
MIPIKRVSSWMNVIRNEYINRDKLLECFWESQLLSKYWLCQELSKVSKPSSIIIHGAWYGSLAGILLDEFLEVESIECVDIDPECKEYVRKFNPDQRVSSTTCSMEQYIYHSTPDIIINTSCEHVTQDVYDEWYGNIPNGALVVVQSNNMFHIEEHINCSSSLEEFTEKSGMTNIIMSDTLGIPNAERYMIIGRT